MHYKRWWRTGEVGDARSRSEQVAARRCSVPGCGRGGKLVKGLCRLHYERKLRTGSVERTATEPGTVRVEVVVYRGIEFRRYPDAEQVSHRRYFKPGGQHVKAGVQALHQEIWKDAHGPIPEGYHIHHIDEDPTNNALDNLVAIPAGVHTSHHTKGVPVSDAQREHLDRVRPLAAEWHRSEEGRAWHREHARKVWHS